MTFMIALFVLLMQFVWKYIDDLVGKGLETVVIVKLLFFASSTFVPMALPLAILLSSIMSFGNLGEHNELVAMKAAGIPLKKIMRPLIVISLLLSVVAFVFSNYVLPVANLKMVSLLTEVREQKPAFSIKEGVFNNTIEGYIIKVAKKDQDGETVYNIMIYDHTTGNGNTSLTIAEKGKITQTPDKHYLIIQLINGYKYIEKIKSPESQLTRPFQRAHFSEASVRYDLSAFSMNKTNEAMFKNSSQMMNIQQLSTKIDSMETNKTAKRSTYTKQLLSNFYFFSIIDSNAKVSNDSLKTLNYDLLKNFDKNKKTFILSQALQFARNIKDNIQYQFTDRDLYNKSINKHKIEWHKKFTLSIACFILFFIGAPLGAIVKKGGFGWPVVISVAFFVLYYVISITGEKIARDGGLSPFIGMWLASGFLMPLGIFLTVKATSDSPLLNSNFIFKLILKLKQTLATRRLKS